MLVKDQYEPLLNKVISNKSPGESKAENPDKQTLLLLQN